MTDDQREIRALIEAAYRAISGPPGPREWELFRALFADDARLMPSRRSERGIVREVLTVEGYVDSRGPLFEQTAFYEEQADVRILVFGDVAHGWSAYIGRYALDGPAALRGVNSFQFHRGPEGWRIVSLLWDAERPGVAWPGEPFGAAPAGRASRTRRPRIS